MLLTQRSPGLKVTSHASHAGMSVASSGHIEVGTAKISGGHDALHVGAAVGMAVIVGNDEGASRASRIG